jgi:hypothetical protein
VRATANSRPTPSITLAADTSDDFGWLVSPATRSLPAAHSIAAVIGRKLGLPVETVPQETYGPLGPIFATDQPSSSTRAR